MKTPKQKAKELVEKYKEIIWQADKFSYLLDSEGLHFAKQCALIDIQNSIDFLKYIDENEAYNVEYYIKELIEIKTEIEKL
jgi:hypothetical protein